MGHFEAALGYTLKIEGGFSDDPKDSGGKTNWGVTEKLARAAGYRGPMEEMSRDVAVAIYRDVFWDALKLPAIANLTPPLAYEMFDSAVNIGPDVVAKWLQRALNALNDGETRYEDVKVDGDIGPATLGALRAFLALKKAAGEKVLIAVMNGLQVDHYMGLAEKRPKDERFFYGWVLQRVVNR
jgi:lysozyme family protein